MPEIIDTVVITITLNNNGLKVNIEPKGKTVPGVKVNAASKKINIYVDGKYVGFYDSITLCASTLGLSRAMVKKAIESGKQLDNGFILKFN